jgi:hypothetical protein
VDGKLVVGYSGKFFIAENIINAYQVLEEFAC